MTFAHKQQGSTLLVALVMLMLLTLIAISAMNSTTSSIQVVGNAQFREEASAAAQQGIEGIISSSNFTVNPAASTVAVTFGAAAYTAQVETPTCISSLGLTNADLDPTDPNDSPCISSGSATNTGIVNAAGVAVAATQSWCYDQKWDIRATVADTNTGANTAMHQGVSMRVPTGTVCP